MDLPDEGVEKKQKRPLPSVNRRSSATGECRLVAASRPTRGLYVHGIPRKLTVLLETRILAAILPAVSLRCGYAQVAPALA